MAMLDPGGSTRRPTSPTPPPAPEAVAPRSDAVVPPRAAARPDIAATEPAPIEGRINGHHSYPEKRRVPWLAIAGAVVAVLVAAWLLTSTGDDVARVEALDAGTVTATGAATVVAAD